MAEDKSFKAVLLLILLLSALWLTLTYTRNVYYVPSRSMEPTLMPGDLIIVKPTTAEKLNQKYRQGEKPIIVFNSPQGLIVHRIHYVVYGENRQIIGFKTKGDNNPSPDAYLVEPKDVRGEVVFRIPWLGMLVMFTKSKLGLTLIGIILAFLVMLNLLEAARWRRRG